MPRDLALIDRLAALHPAVVSDCLDSLGHRHQVMAPGIRPLATDMRLAGVAATVRCVAVDAVPGDHDEWHRGTIEAVDALAPGDVLVASHCDAAFWGSCSQPPRASAVRAASSPTPMPATRSL